jgi:hypothetical protein
MQRCPSVPGMKPAILCVDENTYREIVTYQKGFRETSIQLKGLANQVRVFAYRMHHRG